MARELLLFAFSKDKKVAFLTVMLYDGLHKETSYEKSSIN